jgi:hypothetical protein
MTATLNGFAEPDEPNQPKEEVTVLITIPEEFVAVVHHELLARKGRVTGLDVQEDSVAISATFAASQYKRLVEAVVMNTEGRGRIGLKRVRD